MKIIGVGGQLSTAKDTLSNYLVDKLNENYGRFVWKRVGFADAVKKVFMDSFDVSLEFIEKWKRISQAPPGFDKNIRQSLQFIGDGFRQIRNNIWIEIALRDKKPKIISDVRYLNEAKVIKENQGFTILIWRPGFENDDPNPSESQIKPTVDWFVESGLEGYVGDKDLPGEEFLAADKVRNPSLFDFFIRNEGTIDQFYKKADDLIVPVIEKRYN